MIRAVIFDCFGVVITDALSALCGKYLADRPEAIRDVWGWIDLANKGIMPADEASAHIAEIFGLSYPQYRAQLSSQETKDQVLLDYIGALRPRYKTAMLSNAGAGSLERRFAAGELARYFDEVVASAEIRYAKPEAEAYQITAERLGVQPAECVLLDDRKEYCQGAAEAGMRAVLYTNFVHSKPRLEALLADS